ncbi:hypothetical protein MPSEU_000285400 [Mayamaea pseudoterrestris]|nr:hypothetical protein MPSEU_000285400 [Mayamaea pseudoterrestris]
MKLTKGTGMTREEIQTILDAEIPYADENQPEAAEQLLTILSEEQVEFAAQSSTAYWLATLSDKPPTDEERHRMALREARRYLSYHEVKEEMLKKACDSRKDRRIDLMRSCFMEGVEYENDEDSKEAERIRDTILNELKRQPVYARGTDKEGRAILIVGSRTEGVENDEDFIMTQLYNVERAIAASEYTSNGLQEMICVVFDFADLKHSMAPSISLVKDLVGELEACYCDRLDTLFIVDPPFWMRTIWGAVKPFLHPDTQKKIIMAKGDKEKSATVGELVEEDQAMPFLLPEGELSEEVSVERFTKDIPFYCLYEEDSAGKADADDEEPETTTGPVLISHASESRLHCQGTF